VLKVDGDPIRIAYLKFDLRRVTASIRSAALRVFPVNSSDDGGRVYAISDATWTEVAADDETSGSDSPGLRWIDVDTDGDGGITDSDISPWAPDLAMPIATIGAVTDNHAVTVDVTEIVRASTGGVLTLAIGTEATNGTAYASRDDGDLEQQPELVLHFAEGICGNGVVEPGEGCDAPTCCTACRRDAPGASCVDDRLFCNGVERCAGQGQCRSSGDPCVSGAECADVCDERQDRCARPAGGPCGADGLYCTADRCDEFGRCAHVPIAACAIVTDVAGDVPNPADCYGAFAGITRTDAADATCVDGDSACDRDGARDGGCAFDVAVCVLQADMVGCGVEPGVTAVGRLVAVPASAFLALPSVPTRTPACGAPNRLRVPLKKQGRKPGKLVLKLTTETDGTPKKDRDKLVLRCLPALR
jgi:hypothetical protein